MPAAGPLALLLPVVLTALAYVAAGQLALLLAIPPGFAAPIYPPAGIALAAVLAAGWRALPGVLTGAFVVNALLAQPRGLPTATALLLALAIALGATAQAALGGWLVRRFSASRAMAEPRDVLVFGAGGAVLACLVSASVATLAMVLAGILPIESRSFTWWTWWAGDALGVLIGAPVVLSLVGRPRADWAPRRISLALPLLAALSLLALATVQVSRLDQLRSRAVFEQAASAAADAIDGHLRQGLFALQAMHGLFNASSDVSRQEMRRAAEPWLNLQIDLQALGYAERVPRAGFAEYEARVSALDGRPLRAFDRQEGGAPPISANDPEALVMRFIEPFGRNAAALGVNVLSVPAAREAVGRAVATGQAAATAGFRLTQEAGDQTGVVVYRSLHHGDPATPQEREQSLYAINFVTMRMDQSLAAAMKDEPRHLRACLIDAETAAPRRRLAGPVGCEERGSESHVFERPLAFGGRQWLLRVTARPADFVEASHLNAWLFSSAGLLSTALLAVLLLTVTGRTRRIESAVAQRTAELQREMGERARTEQALRESEQRLRKIFEQAPVGIVYADLAGRVREANPKFRDMLGQGAESLTGRSLAELTPEEERGEHARQLTQLLQGDGASQRRRQRLLRRDGQPFWVQIDLSVLRDATGRPQRLVAVLEDITEHLKLVEAERGRDLAESANRAKSEFLSRMSHELRTPLNAMLGFAQLLELDRRPPLGEHQREWTAQIQHAGWHLLEMINDILDLSRIESGMVRLEATALDMAALIGSCLAMVAAPAAQRGIELRHQVAPGTPAVLADATRLKQVLTNLLSNAVKYNVDHGRVTLDVAVAEGGQIEIRVTDTGLGLTASQLAELFQPFNRLGREHSGIEGTGIGLVISRRLAELMGGSLTAHSESGRGSTFVLRLPAAPSQAEDETAFGGIDPLAAPYRQRQVHYVEDNETNAEVMRGILAQRPQVQMTVSTSGLDGLAAIRATPPDLILLDMHLPDIDGLELLRHLKHDLRTADVPIVVVSADATPSRINEAIAAGAAQYLTKPLNLSTFLALIDGLLGDMDTRFG